MKTHILMLSEKDKLLKMLSSLTKTDQVLLLHPAKENTVSIKDYQLLSSSKCKIQFIEIPETDNPEIGLAYIYGKLTAEYPDATVNSADPLFVKLPSENLKPKQKRTRKAELPDFSMPAPIEVDKKQEKPTLKQTETDFDKAYDELQKKLSTFKAGGFDPASHIGSLCKAVALMDTERIDFKDAIEACSSKNTAKKLTDTLTKSEQTWKAIAEMIRSVNNLDK